MSQHDESSAAYDPPSALARITTGNRQADEILGGGFPADSINVVMGQPGTGKTIFVEQLVFHNAGADRPILYLTTMSEPLPKVVRYLQQFPFFDESKIGSEIIYEDIGPELAKGGIDALVPRIQESVKSLGPKDHRHRLVQGHSRSRAHDPGDAPDALRVLRPALGVRGDDVPRRRVRRRARRLAPGVRRRRRHHPVQPQGARRARRALSARAQAPRQQVPGGGPRLPDHRPRARHLPAPGLTRVPQDLRRAEGAPLLGRPRARPDARRRHVARVQHARGRAERLGQDHAGAPVRPRREPPRRAQRLRELPGERVSARLGDPGLRRRRRGGRPRGPPPHLSIAGGAPDRQHPGRALPARHRERHPPRGHRRHRRSRRRRPAIRSGSTSTSTR